MPWPVFTEADLLLRSRGHAAGATRFAEALRDGIHRLEAPNAEELAMVVELAHRYADQGVDVPDLAVMAMAATRDAAILTWDFRHFRAVRLHRNHSWRLLVSENRLADLD